MEVTGTRCGNPGAASQGGESQRRAAVVGGWGRHPGGQSLCARDIWVVESGGTERVKRSQRLKDGGVAGCRSGGGGGG